MNQVPRPNIPTRDLDVFVNRILEGGWWLNIKPIYYGSSHIILTIDEGQRVLWTHLSTIEKWHSNE